MTAHPDRSAKRIADMGASVVAGDVMDEGSLRTAVSGADAVVQALTFPTFPVAPVTRAFTAGNLTAIGRSLREAAGRAVAVAG